MTALPFGTFSPAFWQRGLLAAGCRMPVNGLGRRLGLWLRKPVLLAIGKNPVDVERLGFRMRLVPHDNVSEKRMLAMPQFFDSAELALLEKRICSGFQLVDIGANAGIYSLFAAARGAKVLAIEAQPEMQQRLETNIGLNNFSSIHLAKCAVADREGEIEFHLSADNRGQASLTRTGGEALKVPCRPLLALMDEAGITQPDALKIDIEGAEDVVLGHFFRMAPRQRWPKLLFMERNTTSWREDIQATCRSLGYRDLAPGKMNVIMELG